MAICTCLLHVYFHCRSAVGGTQGQRRLSVVWWRSHIADACTDNRKADAAMEPKCSPTKRNVGGCCKASWPSGLATETAGPAPGKVADQEDEERCGVRGIRRRRRRGRASRRRTGAAHSNLCCHSKCRVVHRCTCFIRYASSHHGVLRPKRAVRSKTSVPGLGQHRVEHKLHAANTQLTSSVTNVATVTH